MHLFRSLCLYLVFFCRDTMIRCQCKCVFLLSMVKVVGRWMICWLVNNVHTNNLEEEGEKMQYSWLTNKQNKNNFNQQKKDQVAYGHKWLVAARCDPWPYLYLQLLRRNPRVPCTANNVPQVQIIIILSANVTLSACFQLDILDRIPLLRGVIHSVGYCVRTHRPCKRCQDVEC